MEKIFSIDKKKLVYENPWMRVLEYDITRRGEKGIYSIVERKDCALIIPLSPSQKTVLLKVYRFPTDSDSWEFPMGAVEKDEKIEATAIRELKEETNINAKEVTKIGEFLAVPGLTPQKVIVFVAHVSDKELDKSKAMKVDEIKDIKRLSVEEVKEMVLSGEITDGYTLASMTYLMLYLKK
ncbi:MAG: NUDIX hydrolase [archaeon]